MHHLNQNAARDETADTLSPVPLERAAAKPRLSVTKVVAVLVAVATIAILVKALLMPAASAPGTAGATGTPGAPSPQVGHLAPEVTLLDLKNQHVTISSLRGKVVVLNFWYVACEPCRYEMPALQKTYDAKQQQGLVVVGVDVSDDAQTISNFLQQLGVTYPILRDVGQRAAIQYQLTATPTSFFLDRQGVIRHKVVGPLDSATLASYTTSLLDQK